MTATAGSESFYVLRRGGEVRRLAKLSDRGAWAWMNGGWVSMPDLRRAVFEDASSDYEEVTSAEMDALIEEYTPNPLDLSRF